MGTDPENGSTPGPDGTGDHSNEDNKDNKSTPEPNAFIQTELAKYREAIESEFKLGEDGAAKQLQAANVSVNDLRSFWRAHLALAAARIAHLAQHAKGESVQLAASKFICTEAFAETGSGELEDILKQLSGLTRG